MDYGDLFTRAWRIVWHNKFMFVLGFLAALGSSAGNNFRYSFDADEIPPGFEPQIELFLERFVPILLGLMCLAILIGVVLWLVRLTAQAGMISAAARLENGEKVTFGEAISAGLGKLGRMVGINLVLYGPFILVVLVLVGFIFLLVGVAIGGQIFESGEGFLEGILGSLAIFVGCLALMFCFLLPIMLVISVIYPFAQRGAVLQDLSVMESIGHGWQVVKSNLVEVIILVLFFLVLGIVFGFAVFLITLPLTFLAFMPVLVDVITSGTFAPGNFILLACGGFVLAVVIALVNAVLVTFRSATVTLAYQQFIAKAAK